MESKKAIAFFDLDGTITRGDTLLRFLVYDKGIVAVAVAFFKLIPPLIAGRSSSNLKEALIGYLYKGRAEADLKQKGIAFCSEVLPDMVMKDALDRIAWHKANGHEISVVTASSKLWLEPWCFSLGINIIATNYEVVNGKLTGKFEGKNCKGPEKVNRIKQVYDLKAYDEIYAYGNSKADEDMLGIATHPYMNLFKK